MENVILHAGNLLRNVYLTFREKTYDDKIAKIKRGKNLLIVQDGNNRKRPKGGIFNKFPTDFGLTEEEKQAVLCIMACNEPAAYHHDLIEEMFVGKSSYLSYTAPTLT